MAETTVLFLSLVASVITSLIAATWILSTKISTLRSDVLLELGTLKTDLAVLKKSEEARDEKISRMWDWWMKALEHGWMGHLTSLEKRTELTRSRLDDHDQHA